jgi:4-hydroxybenzoate polyprenyltransferase
VLSTPGSSTARSWIALARWADWGESKLPLLASAAVLLTPDVAAMRLLGIVTTVAAGAAFGFGLNEVADRKSDAMAGKLNRAAALHRGDWLLFLIITCASAFGLSLVWAPDAAAPVFVLLSLGVAWVYSLPPIRLKERGRAGMVSAAAAQWGLPVLVVAAVSPGGWHRPQALLVGLLSAAIGLRSIAVHQLADATADRRAGVSTYLSGRTHANGLLEGIFGCELVLLAAAMTACWPRSLPAVIALVAFGVYELSPMSSSERLSVRLAGYRESPLSGYYFLALPVALAVKEFVRHPSSPAVPTLLLVLVLPQLVTRLRRWTGARPPGVDRAIASTHRPVVSAREPQQ